MKIILKYILTNVKERKTRTAVMFLSILLSTVLLFVSLSIGASYEKAQQKMARGMAGTATLSVASKTPDTLINLEDVPESSSIKSKVGMLEKEALYHEKGYYESIDLVASDLEQLNKINKPRLVNGGEIKDFTGNQIILPDRFTSKYNIKKGDKITLQINEKPYSFTVAEIAKYDTVFLRSTRGATAMLPKDTLQNILQKGKGYSEILIEQQGVSANNLLDELSGKIPDGFQVKKVVNEALIAAGATQKSMPFYLISFFSLVMSVFIIYSSYKVITLDRLPIIGTFRSIGASQKTVTQILMLESALYGCVGGLAGIPIGMAVLQFILQGMGSSLAQGTEIPMVIPFYALLLAFGVALLVSMLSAWIPVSRASRLPIKAVVLGNVEEKQVSNHSKAGLGIVLFVLAVILPRIAPENLLYPVGGLSLLGMIVATIMMIPFLTNVISRLFRPIYRSLFKNEGLLSLKNLRNNRNVTQNITLLFISISSLIAITAVGGFVTSFIGDSFAKAELQGFATGEMKPAFVDKVQKMDGIEKVLPVYVLNSEISSGQAVFTRFEATDNLESYNSMFNLKYGDEEMKKTAQSSFSNKPTVILSEDALKKYQLKVGESLPLSNGQKENTYTIVGSFQSRATDVELVIPAQYARQDFSVQNYELLAYTAKDPSAIMVQIRNLFGSTPNWSRTVEEFNTDAQATVGAFLKPMNSMTYFILLLATVGIINNLLINFIQKRRSIAMYKSVGMSNKQNLRMTLIESLTSGIIGAGIAIGVSYLEIQTIFMVVGPKLSVEPNMEILTLLSAGALGILITVIGSVVPVMKTRSMKLVKEIKSE